MRNRPIIDNLKFRATVVSLYTDWLVKIIRACQCSYVFINKTSERIFPYNRERRPPSSSHLRLHFSLVH